MFTQGDGSFLDVVRYDLNVILDVPHVVNLVVPQEQFRLKHQFLPSYLQGKGEWGKGENFPSNRNFLRFYGDKTQNVGNSYRMGTFTH